MEDEKKNNINPEPGNPAEIKPQSDASVAEGEQQPDVRIPLTFGRWFAALVVALLLGLVPMLIWLGALGYLVWTDGPKDDPMANMYEMFQRLYPLMGFALFMCVGLGWRITAGRARGKGTMLSSAIMGTILVLLCNFAHFYIMDYKYYPYVNRGVIFLEKVDTTELARRTKRSRNDFPVDCYNYWVKLHNDWVRSGSTGRTLEIPIAVAKDALGEATKMPAYKKWYEEDYNKWVELKNSLLPEYNNWAQTANKPLWTPSEKHELMPTTISGVIKGLPAYVLSYPKRLKAHMDVSKKASVIIGISWVIWMCGFLFGGLWINRTYVSKDEMKLRQVAARAAAIAAKRTTKTGAGARKPARERTPAQDEKSDEAKSATEEKKEESSEEKPAE